MKRSHRSRHLAAVYFWVSAFGIDLRTIRTIIPGLLRFFKGYRALRKQLLSSGMRDAWPVSLTHPQLHDYCATSGTMRGHYFLQDLWVAQRIFRANPPMHLDVASRIDGFVAHLASFRDVDVLDIRPNESPIRAIRFVQADMTNMDDTPTTVYPSVSCLHALEHFGLGRYGDPIDALGYVRGFASLSKRVSPGGTLYLSVPVGRQRVEFNAHRVFSPEQIERLITNEFTIAESALIDDDGRLHETQGTLPQAAAAQWYGCAIFILQKRASDRPV